MTGFSNVKGGTGQLTERDADAEVSTDLHRDADARRFRDTVTIDDGVAVRYPDGCVVGVKHTQQDADLWLDWLQTRSDDPARFEGAYTTPASAAIEGGRVHVYTPDGDELPLPLFVGCGGHL